MPWEKDFDVEEALGDAMRAFWAKGYEATSMTDLTAAMNINKGSLYNAYGGKKQLFTSAIVKYRRDRHQATLDRLEQVQDPLRAIDMLFETLVAESLADAEKRGCFLVNTALEFPHQPEDIQRIVKEAFADMKGFLERRLAAGQVTGTIRLDLSPKDAAKSLMSLIIGLRVLARGVFTSGDLNTIRTQAVLSIAA